MNAGQAQTTAQAMVQPGKGILAIDETPGTCTKRFAELGIESTEESRRRYRQLLCTAPGLGEFISGAILVDETLRARTDSGDSFPEALRKSGIIPGIKVDRGAKPLANTAGESVTEGLDGLRERLAEYAELGARFAKWRAVIRIGPGVPTRRCIEANAHALGRYAALAQEAGLAPIVEPEVLMDGDHDIERAQETTEAVLRSVFAQLAEQGVALEGVILKPNMVTPGKSCPSRATPKEIAERTLTVLRRCVPAAVPGVAFLSGGLSGEEACANLSAMNAAGGGRPWALSFSFGRALQYPAVSIWGGADANAAAAQQALLHRARMASLASLGRYSAADEP